MCTRPVSGRPQSRSGSVLSSCVVLLARPPLLFVNAMFARDRDSVYDVWSCDPRPEAVDELRLQRVVVRLAVVIPDGDVGVAEHAKLPQRSVCRRRRHVLQAIVDAVVVAVAGQDLVARRACAAGCSRSWRRSRPRCVAFGQTSCWNVTFHCQLFGVFMSTSRPELGAPKARADATVARFRRWSRAIGCR